MVGIQQQNTGVDVLQPPTEAFDASVFDPGSFDEGLDNFPPEEEDLPF